MEKKTESQSKSVFAVNATASLNFKDGSIEEQIRPMTEEEIRAAAQRKAELQQPTSEIALSVAQASSEALKILENQGFGRSINAAAQSLLANGFLSGATENSAPSAPATSASAKTNSSSTTATTSASTANTSATNSTSTSSTASATAAALAAAAGLTAPRATEPTARKSFVGAGSIAKTAFDAPVAAAANAAAATALTANPALASDAAAQLPIIGDYMDYRRFLLDYYLYRREQSKKQLRPYSYSTFAAAANIKSPNYLKMIIEGKRNLSPDMIGRFAKATGLNKADSDQFRMLVQFNQSADPSARNLMLKDLSDLRVERQLKAGEIDRKAWDRLPSWVAWVLYALLDQAGVDFKIDSLRDLLRGKAKNDEIEAALKSLVESGEVLFDSETGIYSKAKNRSDTPEEIPVALIRKLQAQLMLLGLESLYQDSPTEREFGTLTVALTQTEFEELRFKLRQMRKQVHKDISIQRMQTPGERVYQLNLQLFPVTDKATT